MYLTSCYCSLCSQQLGQNAFQITFGDGILPRMSRDFAIIHGKTPRGILPVNSYLFTPLPTVHRTKEAQHFLLRLFASAFTIHSDLQIVNKFEQKRIIYLTP